MRKILLVGLLVIGLIISVGLANAVKNGYGPGDGDGICDGDGPGPGDGVCDGSGKVTQDLTVKGYGGNKNCYGPGDGTGNDGEGPQDGTGYGPGGD